MHLEKDFIQRGSSWALQNGLSLLLWFDNWIDLDPIVHRFPLFLFSERDWFVDIIQGNSWKIPTNIPAEVLGFLLQQTNLIPTRDTLAPDTLSWKGNSTGVLSLKGAWDTLRSREAVVEWHGLVWNKLTNPRLSCFSWRLLLRKMPTDFWAMQKGCSMASRCYSCHSYGELDLHLFFTCSIPQ